MIKIDYVCRMKLKFLALLSICSLFACDNDLDLTDDYKDIPVVYAIMNMPSSEQFIRIEKGFIDETTSALQIATNPDSLYYMEAVVSIKDNQSGTVFPFEMVDGAEFGLPRDPGIFASDPNYLYKSESNFQPQPGQEYTLQIQRPGLDTLVTATTVMVGIPNIVRPSQSGAASLDFAYNQNTTLKWNGDGNSGLYDIAFNINYRERNIIEGGAFENKSVRWTVRSNFDDETMELQGLQFYGAISNLLDEDPDVVRKLSNLDMIVAVGGLEVKEYVRIGQANSGLTSSQDIPVFTNLSEGRGLFSSRQEAINPSIQLTNKTLDSLRNGIFTKNLGFIE